MGFCLVCLKPSSSKDLFNSCMHLECMKTLKCYVCDIPVYTLDKHFNVISYNKTKTAIKHHNIYVHTDCLKSDKQILKNDEIMDIYCVICNESIKSPYTEYVNSIDFISLNHSTHHLNCSEKCLKKGRKNARQREELEVKIKCNNCQSMKDSMKKCGRCKRVYYCSIECQKNNWKDHKKDCVKQD